MSILTTKPLLVAPPAAQGITCLSGSSYTNYGPWQEFIASSTGTVHIAGVILKVSGIADYEVQVGVGAAGVEQAFGRIFIGCQESSANSYMTHMLPIPMGGVPAGSRITARLRVSISSGYTLPLSLLYYSNLESDYVAEPWQYAFLPDFSANPGLGITCSATPWANVSYVQITAGIPSDSYLLGITFKSGIAVALTAEVDLASGPAGAETVLATVPAVKRNLGLTNIWLLAPLPVPANTRIAFRVRTASAVAQPCWLSFIYLAGAAAGVRTTQVVSEVLTLPVPELRTTHVVVEALTVPLAPARVTQVVAETLSLNVVPGPAGTGVAIWMGEGGGRIWIE